MMRSVLAGVLTAALSTSAFAHFVFVLPEGADRAKVVMSEQLKAADEVDIAIIKNLKLSVRDGSGKDAAVALTPAEQAYTTTLPGTGDRLVHGFVDLGYTQRGTGKAHVLMYYPKTVIGNPFNPKATLGEAAPVELLPTGTAGAFQLQLVARGKPQGNAEVTVLMPDGEEKRVTTDGEGLTPTFSGAGRHGAWARYWEEAAGERDGKRYEQVRHYATLVIDVPRQSANLPVKAAAALPEATSSFGAVVSEGHLYVYGGHTAPTHTYHTKAVSGLFHRMKLGAPGATWEKLPGGPPLQGMNLAAHGGKVYRIGGMQPMNEPGEPAKTVSVADCARFDPAKGTWEALPPLPEPRSSHDVLVIGETLYVVGGWNMRSREEYTFPETGLALDLGSAKLEWKAFSQPFKRRALIAAAHEGKVYVMGGMSDEDEILTETAIFDPKTGTWSTGPELPGSGTDTFGPAAVSAGGRLYVSLGNGELFRMKEGGWELLAKTTPRLLHRLLAGKEGVMVLGGAIKGKNMDMVEVVGVGEKREVSGG